ncbi:MAG: glycosyltransferase [Acidobacteriia bacterium]|nr:glycosyltransferase [Terriglobia bacterium]
MKSVTIGIYVDEEVRRLEATLAGLRAHTERPFELVLLPAHVDAATRDFLSTRGIVVAAPEGPPVGPAAWFNRLAACCDSDVIVFVEAGDVPGPKWLEFLLAALDADPVNGLAGPSTNSAWNEQCALPGAGGSLSEVAATACAAAGRFHNAWRGLAPLHSLADFCYAVKREVIRAIGGADEQYGLGPCWEMDYNIRAARAGYRAVWACSAYVYRPPFTARRAREEARLLQSSKQRYQDRFCTLRLRGEAAAYEPHCRGDACEHFAPAALIRIQEPLPASTATPLEATGLVVLPAAAPPLVSCVMATGNRREFALQAIRYFERQDYPNRELVIVDDGPDDLAAMVAGNSQVRYVRVRPGMTIGAKRNRGCEMAQGAIIAQWDDDDWYSPSRLSAQALPIVSGEADITGLNGTVFFDLPHWRFWSCTPQLHRRMFAEDVHGGTLVFRREVWDKNRYPNASLAEDAALLRGAVYRGARLRRIEGGGLFVYLRHARNAWSFECGRHVDPAGWVTARQPEMGEDLAFYLAQSPARGAAAPAREPPAAQPMVTCIMPTANRRPFVAQAIRCFQRQNYPNRELIILDDGTDPVQDLIPQDPAITYVRLNGRRALGAKRNQACEMARGDVIVHWDDDDWMAEWRLAYQVAGLAGRPQPSACGLSSVYFCHRHGDRAWLYVHPGDQRPWIAGGTMCYHKSLWQQYRFPEIDEGEDTRFIWAVPAAAVVPLPDNRFYVATVHDANTSPKRTSDVRWQARPPSEIQGIVGAGWEAFIGAA